jgi:hypothetical protein
VRSGVIASVLWPMSSRMLFRSTPFIASREANVCRRSCHRKFSILALSTAGLNTRCRKFVAFNGVFPALLGKAQRLWNRLGSVRKIAVAVSFSGTCRAPPCFERGIVRTRFARFTCSQRSPNSSLWRAPY